jgi:tetratricopeptide (TPR) repeat protein
MSTGDSADSAALQAAARDAFQQLRAGNIPRAESLCLQLLAAHPRYFHALHLLGIAALQCRDFPAAAQRLQAAVEADPTQADAHSNLAIALLAQRRAPEALASCDRALRLKAEMPNALSNRGDTLRVLGRPQEALESYDRATVLAPSLIAAHLGRGIVLHELGLAEESLQSFERVLALDPARADALNNRGNALLELDRPLEALSSYEDALRLSPDFAEALSGRGSALRTLGHPAQAIESLDRALALRPGWPAALNNRGNASKELGRYESALADFGAAIAARPDDAEAYCNRGVAYAELRDVERALADFARSTTLRPDFANAHRNTAFALLLKGDFANGWRLHEWRRKMKGCELVGRNRRSAAPLWLGNEPLARRTVLLHAEQGLGDTLQFCRYVPRLASHGARVILEVHSSLTALMASLPGATRIIAPGETVPDHDFQCPLMSLPLACRTTLESIPAEVPYLRADAGRVGEWAAQLGEKTRPRVGLAWSGGFRRGAAGSSGNPRRNMPLAQLAALREARIEFFSLQKGEAAEQELADAVASGWSGPAIRDLTQQLTDFSDTAALIEQLDLVISVDTSIAHLAGALGKPVWILNRFDACWRWLLDREDTPWYPTARLYRQPSPGDWQSLVQSVRQDLLSCLQRGQGFCAPRLSP